MTLYKATMADEPPEDAEARYHAKAVKAVSRWNAADPMLLAPDLEYKLGEKIATGRHTTVFEAKNVKTGEMLAVKVYSLNGAPTSDRRRKLAIKSEIQILASLVSGVRRSLIPRLA